MKLLLCTACADVRKLQYRWTRCECGESAGRYLADGHHAEYTGASARILGLDNNDVRAIAYGLKKRAEWWRMDESDPGVRIRRVEAVRP